MRSGVLHCNYNGAIRPKMRFGCNFWLEGPIDLQPTRLNCILQDLFSDTIIDHIWCAQICAKNAYLALFGHIRPVRPVRHLGAQLRDDEEEKSCFPGWFGYTRKLEAKKCWILLFIHVHISSNYKMMVGRNQTKICLVLVSPLQPSFPPSGHLSLSIPWF